MNIIIYVRYKCMLEFLVAILKYWHSRYAMRNLHLKIFQRILLLNSQSVYYDFNIFVNKTLLLHSSIQRINMPFDNYYILIMGEILNKKEVN